MISVHIPKQKSPSRRESTNHGSYAGLNNNSFIPEVSLSSVSYSNGHISRNMASTSSPIASDNTHRSLSFEFNKAADAFLNHDLHESLNFSEESQMFFFGKQNAEASSSTSRRYSSLFKLDDGKII